MKNLKEAEITSRRTSSHTIRRHAWTLCNRLVKADDGSRMAVMLIPGLARRVFAFIDKLSIFVKAASITICSFGSTFVGYNNR